MKKFNIIIVMIFCFNINFSQQSTEAKQLLNKVSENIKSYKNVFINYVYSLNNEELDIDEENSGSFVKEKEKWKLEFVGITRIFDGEKLYTISPDDEEVTISSENPEVKKSIKNRPIYSTSTQKNQIINPPKMAPILFPAPPRITITQIIKVNLSG